MDTRYCTITLAIKLQHNAVDCHQF